MLAIPRVLLARAVFKSSMRSFHSSASSSRCRTWWRMGSLTEELTLALALAVDSWSRISISSIGLTGSVVGLMLVGEVLLLKEGGVLAMGSLTLIERIGFVGVTGAWWATGTLRGVKIGEGVLGDTTEGVEKEKLLYSEGFCVTGSCLGM